MSIIKRRTLQRNSIYDFLRFIGIVCILLAHMGIPNTLFQIRNFDVPFLVILSGIAYAEFSAIHYTSYFDYLKKRFLRLIMPTWIFLTLYYISFYTVNEIHLNNLLFSYSLLGHEDIGVWIIRIFFSMAILAPFLFWWNKKLNANKKFYIFIATAFTFYEIIYFISKHYIHGINFTIFNVLFMYTFSYGLLYLYGIRLNSFNQASLKKHFALILVILLSYLSYDWILYEKFYPTQLFKYPPEGYYFAYALMISLILFYFSKYTNLFAFFINNKLIAFIGSSTFWIYLWHWYYLKLYEIYLLDMHYLIKFIFIFSLTLATVYIQKKLLFFLLERLHLNKKTKKLLTTVFTG